MEKSILHLPVRERSHASAPLDARQLRQAEEDRERSRRFEEQIAELCANIQRQRDAEAQLYLRTGCASGATSKRAGGARHVRRGRTVAVTRRRIVATKGAGTGERTGAIIAGMMGVIAETTGAANYRDHGQRRRYGDDATDDAWFFLRYSLSVFGYMYTLYIYPA